jgi:hypothetical protein
LVRLSDSELVLLDGLCGPKTQEEVDGAKQRLAFASTHAALPPADAGFIADAVQCAQANGRLTYVSASLRSCSLCGIAAGYATRKRWSRAGAKGSPNYDKPLYLSGFELNRGFVWMRGHASLGCCATCMERVRPHLVAALANLRAELPERLTGSPPRFERHDNRRCTSCGWEGHEGEMRRLLTLFGDGRYPGGCPNCSAENKPLGPTVIESREGFTVVEVGRA